MPIENLVIILGVLSNDIFKVIFVRAFLIIFLRFVSFNLIYLLSFIFYLSTYPSYIQNQIKKCNVIEHKEQIFWTIKHIGKMVGVFLNLTRCLEFEH